MKKVLVLLMLALASAVTVAPSMAADPAAGVFALARHVPSITQVFAAVSLDEAHIETVDGLLTRAAALATEFGAAEVPQTLREILAGAANGDVDEIDAVLVWAGDGIAIATGDQGPGTRQHTLAAVPLDDREAAEAFIVSRLPRTATPSTMGRFSVYEDSSTFILFSDDLLLLLSGVTRDNVAQIASGDYPRLSADESFAAAVSALPGDDYMLGVYATASETDERELAAFGIGGGGAFGVTVLDGSTLTLDVALLPSAQAVDAATIDPDFARFIPEDSGTFIHGTNLGGLIETALSMSAANGNDAREDLEAGLRTVGLDVETLIELTSGDFAVFSRIDYRTLLSTAMNGTTAEVADALAEAYDFGIAFEATDPAEAARLARTLGSLADVASAQVPNGMVAVTDEEIAGADATVVAVTVPVTDQQSITLEFALAASDDILIFGTRGAVERSLAGGPGAPGNPAIAEAARFWLSDATSVWFIDGGSIAQTMSVGVLALLGPAVQSVFDNINDALVGTSVPKPTPTPSPGPFGLNAAVDLTEIYDRLTRFFRHMTVSTRSSAAGTALRVTLTIGE